MRNYISVKAPAKINVHLDVGPKRSDGYHSILSLFQMVDLCDELKISIEKKEIMRADRREDPVGVLRIQSNEKLPKDNTVQKAFNAFFRELRRRNIRFPAAISRNTVSSEAGPDADSLQLRTEYRCSVFLTKRIPQGSGLGGGSSDAAAMLWALYSLFEAPFPAFRLHALAETIGSDVPFFLGRASALVAGRGEQVIPAPVSQKLERLEALIILPEHAVSTAEAYAELDAERNYHVPAAAAFPAIDQDQCLYQYSNLQPGEWTFFNSFQPLIMRRYAVYREAEALFRSIGIPFSTLSGSGSAFVGIFYPERIETDRINAVYERFYRVEIVKMLANSPFEVYNIL